jgi:hypothetical protein
MKTSGIILSLQLIILLPFHSSALQWNVGPAAGYQLPSQVAMLVQDGDTVNIEAGIYQADVCGWTASNLFIRGINGFAHLKANYIGYQGKAIWVIAGNNCRLEYIEFSECSVPDMNGAGIRVEGHNLWLAHCKFHHNENGILAGNMVSSNIVIEYCEFNHNGYGDGYTHNLYINHIDTLTFRFNYSHETQIGHELKSRARVNYILYNRFSNELAGTASRETDLPNGGETHLIGNVFEQGPLGENGNLVGYGGEGLTNNPPHLFIALNNTFVNNRWGGNYLDINPNVGQCILVNNLMVGPGAFFGNTPPTEPDTIANMLIPNQSEAGFVDATNYDYHLSDTSQAVNAGVYPPLLSIYPLDVTHEYVHPAGGVLRCIVGLTDCGAFENCQVLSHKPITHQQQPDVVYYNESLYSVTGETLYYRCFDSMGRLLSNGCIKGSLPFPEATPGIRIVHLSVSPGFERYFSRKLMINHR